MMRIRSSAPTADAEDVDLAIEATLEQGANAFQWIWNGLPPAEKILMAAMAGTGRLRVTKDQLDDLLNKNGICFMRGEVESALATIIRWDLLRRENGGYRFSIPLLQRWVAENRPLRRVKNELDSTEPIAENLFATAEKKYAEGDLVESELLLRRTLAINPHHVQGQLLLGRVHLGKEHPAEAVAVMESAYRSDPGAAREGLIAALLALADTQSGEDEQWQTTSRILRVEPKNSAALAKRDAILRRWADKRQQTARIIKRRLMPTISLMTRRGQRVLEEDCAGSRSPSALPLAQRRQNR